MRHGFLLELTVIIDVRLIFEQEELVWLESSAKLSVIV